MNSQAITCLLINKNSDGTFDDNKAFFARINEPGLVQVGDFYYSKAGKYQIIEKGLSIGHSGLVYCFVTSKVLDQNSFSAREIMLRIDSEEIERFKESDLAFNQLQK